MRTCSPFHALRNVESVCDLSPTRRLSGFPGAGVLRPNSHLWSINSTQLIHSSKPGVPYKRNE